MSSAIEVVLGLFLLLFHLLTGWVMSMICLLVLKVTQNMLGGVGSSS
jgi:hypothetical protein